MYLRSIRIQNARQIRDLDIDFSHRDQPRMLTAVLGVNGSGKTTLLRAVAATLAGSRAAEKLCNARELRTIGENSLSIEAHVELSAGSDASRAYGVSQGHGSAVWRLQSSAGREFFDTMTEEFQTVGDAPRELNSLDEVRNRALSGWFVAGYGVGRTLPAPMTAMVPPTPILGQLGSLFDSVEHGRLVATNFADILADTQGFARALRDVLRDTAGLVPGFRGLELRGRHGVTSSMSLMESRRFQVGADADPAKVPASWLSHGYQSVLALISDLLGRAAISEGRGKVIRPLDLRGVLLIDEVDLHLHPSWQRSVLPALSQAFPRLQIIATTHSPMVIADLRPEQVVVLEADASRGVVAAPPTDPPQLLTAAQLLATYFGVTSSRAGSLRAMLRERDEILERQGPPAPSVAGAETPGMDGSAERLATIERELRAAGVPLPDAAGGGSDGDRS